MTLVVDAAPVVALADRRDPMRKRVEDLLRSESGDLVIPAPVTAEIDYLLSARLGRSARQLFLEDLAAGRFKVACLEPADYRTVAELDQRYADLDAGLADLSIVVLAQRFSTTRVASFDERQFRVLRPIDGNMFTVLPADA